MSEYKSVGLMLSPADYQRLKQYADDRHWSMALAARIIVTGHLDQHETKAEGVKAEATP